MRRGRGLAFLLHRRDVGGARLGRLVGHHHRDAHDEGETKNDAGQNIDDFPAFADRGATSPPRAPATRLSSKARPIQSGVMAKVLG